MKFIDKKITDSYYQIYVILDVKEKNKIAKKIKEEALKKQKAELKKELNLYRSINKKSNNELTEARYKLFEKQYNELSVDNVSLDKVNIAEEVCDHIISNIFDHIDSLNIIQVLRQDTSVIGSLDGPSPLTLIYSFPYLPYDYEMRYPTERGVPYIFTNDDIDKIQTEILIANKFYKSKEVKLTSEFSDLVFSSMCEDNMMVNKRKDIAELEGILHLDEDQLVGLESKRYEIINNDEQKCLIDIKEIYDKEVLEITDDIVLKINYLNTKTVQEFRNKIKEVFSVIYNINSNVMSLLIRMYSLNDFHIDNFQLKHFRKVLGIDEPDVESLKRTISMYFVIAYIFSLEKVDIEHYLFYIEQEYKLLYQIKKRDNATSFEDFANLMAPYYALYCVFEKRDLVTERSYNE